MKNKIKFASSIIWFEENIQEERIDIDKLLMMTLFSLNLTLKRLANQQSYHVTTSRVA